MLSKSVKIVSFILALCMMVLFAASCGDQNGNENKSEQITTEGNSETMTEEEITENKNDEKVSEPDISVILEKLDESNDLLIPSDSKVFSRDFAANMLMLCCGHGVNNTKEIYKKAGFTILVQKHFDKVASDRSDTCAFTIGKREIEYLGKTRTVILTTVRGTSEGEWYSNFNVAPNEKDNAEYAENFMAAAREVYGFLDGVLKNQEDPLVLVAGHSRGAACANLVGVLLDENYPSENTFVYTFATPATVRKEAAEKEYKNIFNIINACDIVPMLPLEAWGFERAGNDIILGHNTEREAKLGEVREIFASLAPTLSSYYDDKHSLAFAGVAEDGLTVYTVMNLLCGALVGGISSFGQGSGGDIAMAMLAGVLPDSDFYPLVTLIGTMMTDNGETAKMISDNHYPTMYLELIKNMEDAE